MKDGRPGRGSDQFPLRLPDGMRDKIGAAATENGRSMNAEIVARLEGSFDDADKFAEARAEIEKLSNQLAYEEGKNASFAQTLGLFADHLKQTDEGKDFISQLLRRNKPDRSGSADNKE